MCRFKYCTYKLKNQAAALQTELYVYNLFIWHSRLTYTRTTRDLQSKQALIKCPLCAHNWREENISPPWCYGAVMLLCLPVTLSLKKTKSIKEPGGSSNGKSRGSCCWGTLGPKQHQCWPWSPHGVPPALPAATPPFIIGSKNVSAPLYVCHRFFLSLFCCSPLQCISHYL